MSLKFSSTCPCQNKMGTIFKNEPRIDNGKFKTIARTAQTLPSIELEKCAASKNRIKEMVFCLSCLSYAFALQTSVINRLFLSSSIKK